MGRAYKNGAVDKKSIIVDLNYDQQKRLLCVAINVNDGNSNFKIYRKETSDITSKWEELPSDKQIRSLMFDTDNKLMGVVMMDRFIKNIQKIIHYLNGTDL